MKDTKPYIPCPDCGGTHLKEVGPSHWIQCITCEGRSAPEPPYRGYGVDELGRSAVNIQTMNTIYKSLGIGLIMVGGAGLFWVFIRMTNLASGIQYSWTPPFSNYETITFIGALAALLCFVVGYYEVKRKTKKKVKNRDQFVGLMTVPPLQNAPVPPLTPKQRRGRALLLTIFIVFVLLDFVLIVLKATRLGFDSTFDSYIRVSLGLALMYAIWIGQRWARWLFVALLCVGSFLILPVIISNPHPVLVAILFVYFFAGLLIGFFSGISSFLQFQRKTR